MDSLQLVKTIFKNKKKLVTPEIERSYIQSGSVMFVMYDQALVVRC